MAEPAMGTQGGEDSVALGGYKAELKRTLGSFQVFAINALLWVVCALFVPTVPGEARLPDLIVVGLALAGGAFFLGLRTFHPEVLETEPGDVSFLER